MPCTNPRCARIREALDAVDWDRVSRAICNIGPALDEWDRGRRDLAGGKILDALTGLSRLADVMILDDAEEIGERARAAAASTL